MTGKLLAFLLGISLVNFAAACGQNPSSRNAVAAALSSHQYNGALQLLDPLLKTEPRDPLLLTLRGLALDGLGRTAESLASFDRALAVDHAFIPALEGAAQTSYLRGNSHALQYVQKLLAVMPAN